jgi:hypothetical protein
MTYKKRVITTFSVMGAVLLILVIFVINADKPSERAAAVHKFNIGETVSVEDFDFVIHSVVRDGDIVTVEASATNRASSSKTVMSHRIKLRDTRGKLYDPSIGGGNSIGTLNPDISGTSKVTFNIPSSAIGFYVAIDEDTDDYGDNPDTALVNAGI